ncbi:unnamed protein product, partial [Debaryomyces fabryi]
MKSSSIVRTLIALASSVSGLTISEPTVQDGVINLGLQIGDDLNINSDAYLTIINAILSANVGVGSINNNGGFYFKYDGGIAAVSAAVATGDIDNEGTIVFSSETDSLATVLGLTTALGTFTNGADGKIYFDSQDGVASVYELVGVNGWENDGLIYMRQSNNLVGTALINSVNVGGLLSGSILEATNDGSICLDSTAYTQLLSIQGDGCMTVLNGGSINSLLDIATGVISLDNDIYLADGNSNLQIGLGSLSISVDGVIDIGTAPTYNLYGFGGGNELQILGLGAIDGLSNIPLLGPVLDLVLNLVKGLVGNVILGPDISYDSDTQTLTVDINVLPAVINAAKTLVPSLPSGITLLSSKYKLNGDYDSTKFEVQGTNIVYNGDVPSQLVPQACTACASVTIPTIPTGTVTSSTTSSTSTGSD